ncbi:MAG: L-2-amino-thiazoline-4-carboxylic acid hydrolase [Candidatus Micrarchaeaceae archaeon]
MSKETLSVEKMRQEIEITSRRIALLHLSYAETLVKELGEEKGKKIIAKAIKEYGMKIGMKTKEEIQQKGLALIPENFEKGRYYGLPSIGMHDRVDEIVTDGEKHEIAYGCVLAKTWKELEQDKLGRLYCYVDIAKYMAYNPDYKLIHIKTIPDGDDYCEFAIRSTSKKEKSDFFDQDKNWFYIDR